MKVINNNNWNHTLDEKVSIALGSFDGIHKGHRQLIKSLHDIKQSGGSKIMVYTFIQHPMSVISPENRPLYINDNEQKINILRDLNIDYLVFNEFTYEFSKVSPREFIKRFLVDKYNIDTIVIGYNYTFGANGEGNSNTMQELGKDFGFNVKIIPPIRLKNSIISSSRVRETIEAGQVSDAAHLLGYPYSISGKVVRGKGRGKHLGFPTANLSYDKQKVIPNNGVYLTLVKVRNIYVWGLTNIGTNPTFGSDELCIETHLIGFDGNIYGKNLTICFLDRIRDEIQFKDADSLIDQMQQDMDAAEKIIYKIIHMCYNT